MKIKSGRGRPSKYSSRIPSRVTLFTKDCLDKGIFPTIEGLAASAKHIYTRPALKELLAFCTTKKNRINAVIVYKFDRFSRNTNEGLAAIALLAKSKVEVLSATEVSEMNPMGEVMRTILIAFAQFDNQNKGERVRDNMREVFRKGLWPFKPPVGYRRKFKTKEENKGLPLLQDQNLAPIIANMFRKAATGIYNKVQLGKMMNQEGFGKYYQSEASHKIVDHILTKTFYYGNMYAPKWDEYAIGQHEPTTNKATFEAAYNKVILKKKNYSYQDTEIYPLKGLLRCGTCGHPLTTDPAQGKLKKVFYYECRNKGCKKARINLKRAHELFQRLLQQVKPSDRVAKLFAHMVIEDWDRSIEIAQNQADKMEEKIVALRKDITSIRKSKDDGFYTAAEAKVEADKIRQEITILEIEKGDIRIEQYNKEIVREFIEEFFTHIDVLWDKLDLPKKQALQQKMMPNGIEVDENKEFRTPTLSPSFKLIEALKDEDVDLVTPWGIGPQLPG